MTGHLERLPCHSYTYGRARDGASRRRKLKAIKVRDLGLFLLRLVHARVALAVWGNVRLLTWWLPIYEKNGDRHRAHICYSSRNCTTTSRMHGWCCKSKNKCCIFNLPPPLIFLMVLCEEGRSEKHLIYRQVSTLT